MRLIRAVSQILQPQPPCVATIGNFDGVHLGHQAMLRKVVEGAKKAQLPSRVITFEPHPQEYFRAEDPPARLSRLREKLQLLQQAGIDEVCVLRFNHALAELEAEEFIERVLIASLQVKHLVIGDDFRFGRERRGDFALLQQKQGDRFTLEAMTSFLEDGARVSSTRIRQALAGGDFALAEQLLGRPYQMIGRIAHGDKIGRTLGFPTANLRLQRRRSPLMGVFAVTVEGIDSTATQQPLQGVANIGFRPTLNRAIKRLQMDIHLLGFSGDCYGDRVRVTFHRKLRDEQPFDDLHALKQQILIDAESARAYFASLSNDQRPR